MVIGIIGASISGLIAGKRLADAGHDVTIIEKERSVGGRLGSITLDGITLDYGLPHFKANSQTFKSFVDELTETGAVAEWTDEFGLYDGKELLETDPNANSQMNYIGTAGNQAIAKDLSRWVDIKSEEQAGGLTYIGPDTTKKRSWMINLTDISVFECDAVILATPAVEAYGIIQTVQNRTATRKIIRHIDEVRYDRRISLACTFDHAPPEWKAIEVEYSDIRLITNESSKRGADQAGLVIHSSPEFYRSHAQEDDKRVKELLLEEASNIIGSSVRQPKSTYLHRWKYFEAQNPIDEYFMELEMAEAPLALIGDYLGGSSLDNAFVSGYNLAEYWINKFSEVPA
ncbi:NAD(P)/FAD-dependent oxidoreductase [Fodinibius halophilus]|uniref:NAD(P)-binding protein n=1 Tax=Fodinibius halophilus TaxID=1736908 RepID=A0A6M1T4A0_9BACT|nr:FAD-dependent oxidoreductase [Fodinibius halophilus]NGP88055.1 NAD(P)-binding protein [Fodinibius halophilus]